MLQTSSRAKGQIMGGQIKPGGGGVSFHGRRTFFLKNTGMGVELVGCGCIFGKPMKYGSKKVPGVFSLTRRLARDIRLPLV